MSTGGALTRVGPTGARPLVGRVAERRVLLSLFERAVRDGLHALIVDGPAGIGKSHLVRTFAEDASAGWFSIAIGWSEDAALPADVVHRLATRLLGGNAETLPWELDDAFDPPSVDGDGYKLARRQRTVVQSMAEAAVDRPSLVVLEDVHWADPLSCQVLGMWFERLTENPRRYPLALVITGRSEGTAIHVDQFLGRLRSSHRCERLSLGPLSRLDEYALIRREMGGSVAPHVADEIHRRARGVPLAVRAATAAVVSKGLDALVARPHAYAPAAVISAELTSSWLRILLPDEQIALAAAAVWDEWITVQSLEHAASVDPSTAREVLVAARRVGIVEQAMEGYRFVHERVRTALRDLLPPDRRREIHADASGATDLSLLHRAEHCAAAGPALADRRRLDVYLEAGRACAARGAWADAAHLLELALDTAGAGDLPDEELTELQFAAGYAHFCNHDVERSEKRLRQLVGGPPGNEFSPLQVAAELALFRLQVTSSRAALRSTGDSAAVREIAESSPNGAHRALALGLLAEASVMAGEPDRALEYAVRAVDAAEEHGADRERGRAWFALGLAAVTVQDNRRAVDAYRRARAHAVAADDALFIGGIDTRLPFAVFHDFDLDLAAATSARGLDEARNDANYANQALALAVQSSVALSRGDLERSASCTTEALEAAERAAYPAARLPALVPAVMALAHAGRNDDAEALLSEHADTPGLPLLLGPLRAYLAPVASLDQPAPPLDGRGPIAVGRLLAATEAATRQRDRETIRRLLPHLLRLYEHGTMSSAYWPVLAPRVLGEAHAAIGEAEQAERFLSVAVRLATNRRAATEQARAALALARQFVVLGCDEAALHRAGEALDLAGGLGMVRIGREAAAILRTHGVDLESTASGTEGWGALVMFDLVGSTELSMRRGDRVYAEFVTRFRVLVNDSVDRHAGDVIDAVGDGALTWFRSSASAEACSLDVLDRIVLDDVQGFAARASLVAGRPFLVDGRPVGSLVNLASRLCAVAGSGQVVASDEMRAWSTRPTAYEPMGRVVLKGVPGDVPIHLFRA